MKLFSKKEEKLKVGRPKLADIKTKKKAIISVCIALVLVVALLLTGAFKLNIIKFNKLKGAANVNLCNEIPARFQPRSESNPEGLHEYGFTDPKFYSIVVDTYRSDSSYCDTITEDELASITILKYAPGGYYGKITNTNGIQYLTSLKVMDLSNNSDLTSIDLSNNHELTDLEMVFNPKLESVNLGNISKLVTVDLGVNNLKGTLDLSNNPLLKEVEADHNNLNEVLLNKDALYEILQLYNNNIKDLGEFNSSKIKTLGVPAIVYNRVKDNLPELSNLYLDDNNYSNFDFSNLERLEDLGFYGNNSPVINLNGINVSKLEIGDTNTSLTEFTGTDNVNGLNLEITDDSKSIKIDNAQNISSLGSIVLGNAELDSLILNNASSLREVAWNYNGNIYIRNLTITNAVNLTSLDLSHKSWNGTELESLNLDGAVNLTSLNIPSRGKLKSLSLKNLGKISYLDVKNNELTDIDVTGMTSLKTLNLSNNKLEEVKGLTTLPNLTDLNLTNNKLTNIDVTGLTSLNTLYLLNNKLEEVKGLTALSNLTNLDIGNNNIKGTLDLSKLTNLYDVCVDGNKLTNIEFPKQNVIRTLYLSDNNLTGTLDLKNLTNLDNSLEIINNPNLSNILLPKAENVENLLVINCDLESIDVSNMPNVKDFIIINNKKLSKIEGLDKLLNLNILVIPNNNLSDVNLDKNKELKIVSLDNNPLSSNIYMTKGEKLDYQDNVRLPKDYNVNYDIEDTSVATIKEGVITAKKEGNTNIKLSNENVLGFNMEIINRCMLDPDNNEEYCNSVNDENSVLPYYLSRIIKVYDITSDVYNVDLNNKTIDVSGNVVDESKITLTSNGLTGNVENNLYVVKDGNNVVATYKILNPGVVKESKPDTKNETTTKTTADKKTSNKNTKKSSSKNSVTTTTDNSDIYLDGSFVSMLTLAQVKGTDRNIIVNGKNVKFTINGKDIVLTDNNINLDVIIEILKESDTYEEVKKDISKGVVVTFVSNDDIKTKILAELNMTRDMLKNTGYRNINIYKYEDGKLTKVAENISVKNNKVSFYINKLGKYIITSSEVKNIKTDSTLINKTNKVNKENYIWFIIPIILILLIIGYVTYKKSKRNISLN